MMENHKKNEKPCRRIRCNNEHTWWGKRNKGFTLAELLIVVAIIAVLVAISIPIFKNQLEKARRAVDLQTARTIESVLANAVNDGTIQFPAPTSNSNYSVYVMISRDQNSIPKGYKNINQNTGTLFCGADKSVVINNAAIKNWSDYQKEIENLLTNSGININSLKVTSKSASNGGWDWIIVNVGYIKDNTTNYKFVTKIYSGNSTETGEANNTTLSNIEKLIKEGDSSRVRSSST